MGGVWVGVSRYGWCVGGVWVGVSGYGWCVGGVWVGVSGYGWCVGGCGGVLGAVCVYVYEGRGHAFSSVNIMSFVFISELQYALCSSTY